MTLLGDFRRLGGFERYALARARILVDRLDGGLAEIVAAKGRLESDEAFRAGAGWLDAYANSLYLSVKNDRDGHLPAARLDAADSVSFLLDLLFALEGRPRPYNKYLEWELESFPLPGWNSSTLLESIALIAGTGDGDVHGGSSPGSTPWRAGRARADARCVGRGPVADAALRRWASDATDTSLIHGLLQAGHLVPARAVALHPSLPSTAFTGRSRRGP